MTITDPFRLVVLTCLWKRPRTTKAVFAHLAWLAQRLPEHGIRLKVLAVGSDAEDSTGPRELAEAAGFSYLSHRNKPVSLKWRHGGEHVRHMDPDALMILGSDDFVSLGYVRAAVDLVRHGWHYVNGKGFMCMDVDPDSHTFGLCFRSRAKRMGAGRVLSRVLLERADFKLWPEKGVSRGCDAAMDQRLWEKGVGVEPHEQAYVQRGMTPYGFASVLATKCDTNIWTFEYLRQHFTPFDPVDADVLREVLEIEYPEAVPLITPEQNNGQASASS